MREPCKPRSEPVTIAEAGDCFVQGITLRDRASLSDILDDEKTSVYDPALSLLSIMVVDDAGDPVWDVRNWDIWAGKYADEAEALFKTTQRVAGLASADAKKN